MSVMSNAYRKTADLAEGNFFSVMSSLANSRLTALCSEWRSKYPKCSLKIVFSMGSEHVAVNGTLVQLCFWDWSETTLDGIDLQLVQDALADVRYICDDYKRAVPNDIEVLPDDSELIGGPNSGKQERTSWDVGEDIRSDGELPGYRCPRPGPPGDAVHI